MKESNLPPLSDPRGDRPFPEAPRAFRVRFWRSFWLSAFALFPLAMALMGPPLLSRFRGEDVVALLVINAAGAVGSALTGMLVPVEVSRHQLRGSSVWGLPVLLEWNEMASVKRRWVFWTYLVVSSGKKKLWIPLHLRHFDEFVECVQIVAPADNVLRLELERRQLKRRPPQ